MNRLIEFTINNYKIMSKNQPIILLETNYDRASRSDISVARLLQNVHL